MWLITLASLAFAHPYEGREADVTASSTIDGEAAALLGWLQEPRNYASLFTDDCGRGFVYEADTVRFTYVTPPWKRKTIAQVSRAEATTMVVDWEHSGIGGFTSRFQMRDTDAEGRVRVTVTHFVDMPGWPLRKPYFEEVQPSWQLCTEGMLANLAGADL